MQAINVSIGVDQRLWPQDLAGSRAHCRMLAERRIISTEAAEAIRAAQAGEPRETLMGKLPGLTAGLEGMAFIRACVTSAKDDAAWVKI